MERGGRPVSERQDERTAIYKLALTAPAVAATAMESAVPTEALVAAESPVVAAIAVMPVIPRSAAPVSTAVRIGVSVGVRVVVAVRVSIVVAVRIRIRVGIRRRVRVRIRRSHADSNPPTYCSAGGLRGKHQQHRSKRKDRKTDLQNLLFHSDRSFHTRLDAEGGSVGSITYSSRNGARRRPATVI